MARGLARAFAAYFSDLLLWISIAGALEVAAVVGMGLLCILSAGYFFESMKKNPVVLVLGGIVALAGTFLMFREVRAMIFPPPALVAPAPNSENPPSPQPAPDTTPAPVTSSREPSEPSAIVCLGLSRPSCSAQSKCIWLPSIDMCLDRPSKDLTPTWNIPNTYELTTCAFLPASACKEVKACYWSPLFNRCERLIVGTRLGGAQPIQLSCNSLAESACKARSDCLWILNGCMKDLLKKPQGE